ncbi:MAG: hypothetical protein ACREE6_10440, partial [Limisphaerales bacterium]
VMLLAYNGAEMARMAKITLKREPRKLLNRFGLCKNRGSDGQMRDIPPGTFGSWRRENPAARDGEDFIYESKITIYQREQ